MGPPPTMYPPRGERRADVGPAAGRDSGSDFLMGYVVCSYKGNSAKTLMERVVDENREKLWISVYGHLHRFILENRKLY